MQIGSYTFHQPIALAPMAGVTDLPFRNLCRRFGADLIYSEMVTAKPELLGSRQSQIRLQHTDSSMPFMVQMMGNNPQHMADAARYYADQGAAVIDLNLGCPAKKVCQTQAGSALLKDPALVARILSQVVSASPVPVTLKTRTGWDKQHRNVLDIVRLAEACGIQSITLHGRTRACRFEGHAEYNTIAAVKLATTLPVIANGDIDSAEKAKQVLTLTQADGLMIGRAAFGRPWIFAQIKQFLDTGTIPDAPFGIEKSDLIEQHLEDIYHLYGERQGIRIARKHFGWYVQSLAQQQQHRKIFNGLRTAKHQIQLVRRIFADDIKEGLAA